MTSGWATGTTCRMVYASRRGSAAMPPLRDGQDVVPPSGPGRNRVVDRWHQYDAALDLAACKPAVRGRRIGKGTDLHVPSQEPCDGERDDLPKLVDGPPCRGSHPAFHRGGVEAE